MDVRKSWLLVFALLAVASLFGQSSIQAAVRVEDGPLAVELDGEPSCSRPAEYVGFRLHREGDAGQPLYFSLSEMVDELGNTFPRDLIVLRTPYDSDELRWESVFAEHLLLGAEDGYVDLNLGVHYTELIPAGTYEGQLHSGTGEVVPLRIVVGPFTKVVVDPPLVTIDANAGPGIYKANQSVQVTVQANHNNWILRLSSEGLFFQDENRAVKRHLNEPEETVRPVPLLFAEPYSEGGQSEILQIGGSDYPSGAILEFEIHAHVGWEHRAGQYMGVVKVDVFIEE